MVNGVNVVMRNSMSLRSGNTRSCGCLYKKHKTHGMTKTRIYKKWNRLKQRCTHHRYSSCKGKLAKRWIKFENFYEDMGSKYRERACLMRKNRKGIYCKTNCIWK